MSVRSLPVSFRQHRRQGGFSMFELGIAAVIFAILAVVLLQRVSFYQEQAEIAAARKLVAELQSALAIKVGSLQAQGRQEDIAGLLGQNPMELVARMPQNYRGQFYSPNVRDLEPGSWYFDRSSKKLVYVFRSSKFFQPDVTKSIFFKVEYVGLPIIPAKPARTPAAKLSVVLLQVDG